MSGGFKTRQKIREVQTLPALTEKFYVLQEPVHKTFPMPSLVLLP